MKNFLLNLFNIKLPLIVQDRLVFSGNNNQSVDLAMIPHVKGVSAMGSGKMTIHLFCEEGDEDKVIQNIPEWVGEEVTVVKSVNQVFLRSK